MHPTDCGWLPVPEERQRNEFYLEQGNKISHGICRDIISNFLWHNWRCCESPRLNGSVTWTWPSKFSLYFFTASEIPRRSANPPWMGWAPHFFPFWDNLSGWVVMQTCWCGNKIVLWTVIPHWIVCIQRYIKYIKLKHGLTSLHWSDFVQEKCLDSVFFKENPQLGKWILFYRFFFLSRQNTKGEHLTLNALKK